MDGCAGNPSTSGCTATASMESPPQPRRRSGSRRRRGSGPFQSYPWPFTGLPTRVGWSGKPGGVGLNGAGRSRRGEAATTDRGWLRWPRGPGPDDPSTTARARSDRGRSAASPPWSSSVGLSSLTTASGKNTHSAPSREPQPLLTRPSRARYGTRRRRARSDGPDRRGALSRRGPYRGGLRRRRSGNQRRGRRRRPPGRLDPGPRRAAGR